MTGCEPDGPVNVSKLAEDHMASAKVVARNGWHTFHCFGGNVYICGLL